MGPDGIERGEPPEDRRGTWRIDVGARLVPHQLEARADEITLGLLGSLGRTEDVVVSPSGSRLAIAAFHGDAIAILDVSVEPGPVTVRLADATIVRADGLARPHGLAFVDDETLLVANRESELVLLDVGGVDPSALVVTVPTRVLVGGDAAVPVRTPGSVATRLIGENLVEVFVCNNYVNEVTRYIVDRSAGWRVVDAEPLLAHGLEVPDGIALSHCGTWLAVSNHNTHSVLVYRYDEQLGPTSEPDAVLHGMNYPHGLAFTADDRHLLVADAGLPYVLAYGSDDGNWSGSVKPVQITRVLDDDTFHRGRHNPQEGGPKGIAVVHDRIAAVTTEFQPLAFFALADLLGERLDEHPQHISELRRRRTPNDVALRRALGRLAAVTQEREDVETARVELAATLDGVAAAGEEFVAQRDALMAQRDGLVAEREGLIRHGDDADESIRSLTAERDDAVHARDEARESAYLAGLAVQRSRSWRMTAPLRSFTAVARRLRRPIGQ